MEGRAKVTKDVLCAKRLIRYLFSALAEVNAKMISSDNYPAGSSELAKNINLRVREIQSALEILNTTTKGP